MKEPEALKELVVIGLSIPAAVYIPVLYFLWVSVFLLLKKIFFNAVRRFAIKTATKFDDILLNALDLPLLLLIFVSGAFVLDNIFQFGTKSELLMFVDIAFRATAIIAIVIFFERLFKGLIENYTKRIAALRGSRGVLHVVVRAIVIGLGILILLDNFGVSITPILASLGIGSLAVALALQPTLENFFSGIQIVIDKPVKVGQFIRLESGEEGYVEKIGWRSTWIRMLPNNVVVLPNKLLVNSRVLNYYYPETEMAVLVQVGVHYDSDLEHVERVTIEVGEDVLKTVQGGVGEFKPFIRYHTFNDFSIDFTVILRVKEFVDGYLIKHEFIKRLHKRYNAEGIVIPFPISTLDWNKGSSPLKISKAE
ncbi:mechanosensitive ion channel family protein [Candidatus Omnitrophota bacterium]